ncbi:hypothetical protein [Neobacillus cucumis]|uniref:hypothetical protein n=1 Tax=Neobacillus cucumis TaxID=1740721 RepID=UPI0015E08478|nr:hypothetical protein [Neobacillus cucumis]
MAFILTKYFTNCEFYRNIYPYKGIVINGLFLINFWELTIIRGVSRMEKMNTKKDTLAKMFENWKKNVVMGWGVVELTESVKGNKSQKLV